MRHEILQYLSTLIAFQSTEGRDDQKRACLDWIAETFLTTRNDVKSRGDHVALREERGTWNVERSNIHGAPYLFLTHPTPKLLWFAHIDVVPGEEEQFTLRCDGDRLFGRGTCDMKGAALPFLLAYRDARTHRIPPVSILLTSDEEVAGHSISTLLSQHTVSAPVAMTPDSGGAATIIVEHKGVVWADLCATGRGGHAAMPWEGDNPILLLADALRRLRDAFPAGTEHDWRVTVTPAQLRGSDARNVIPNDAHCSLDIRFPPKICPTPDDALSLVRSSLPKGTTLTAVVTADPLKTDPDHPMVQRVRRIAEAVTDDAVIVGREHGASDARFFGTAGIPAFIYGPTGGGIHGTEEWVSLTSLLQHVEINRRLLEELAKT